MTGPYNALRKFGENKRKMENIFFLGLISGRSFLLFLKVFVFD